MQYFNSSRKLAFPKAIYRLLGLSAVAYILYLWIKTSEHPGILIHILISMLAFGFLGMAALQAALLYVQNQSLRGKATPRMMRLLPPLQTMETFFFKMIGSGFFLLSISLFSALIFLNQSWNTSNGLQKIILFLLAWGLFAGLLLAHHYTGLRGIKAIRWTLLGVGLLTLAYLMGKHF